MTAAADFVQRNAANLFAVVMLTALVTVGGLGWTTWTKARRRRRLERLSDLAQTLAGSPSPDPTIAQEITGLRAHLGRLPSGSSEYLEGLYRWVVAEVVKDRQVTQSERTRLDRLAQTLGLSQEVTRRAEVEGFLQGFSALVADGHLTTAEEGQLADLRKALRVSEEAVRAQLDVAEELRKAREVAAAELSPVTVSIKLRKDEVCYHTVPFTEKHSKVSRTYVQDGVRHTDRDLLPVRQGTLYVTNQRILVVAEGTTNIKLESILDTAIDTQARVLALVVDGRKTPFYFDVADPYVTEAYISRAVTR